MEQRGVNQVEALVNALGEDFNLDACLAAVAQYDRENGDTPGLLVYRIREAAKSKYKPLAKRSEAPAGEVTDRLLRTIRGSCNSPNGFTRAEARDMFSAKAERLRMPVDRLIDEAMGVEWQVTPPHRAFDPEVSAAERVVAYHLVSGPGVVARLEEIEI